MPSTADWSSPAFLDEATDWIDEQLLLHGLERTGRVEQPHLRPWATALRAETTGGPVWLKAPAPGTASEVGLYAILSRAVPDASLTPVAIDAERAWVLLPDGGPTIGERLGRDGAGDALADALAVYGRLQRALEPHVEEMLAAGVADMRPAAMPERFEEALAVVQETPDGKNLHERLAAERPTVLAWSARLDESVVPASLDHNDLHPWNVLGPPYRFYDWGDAVVAHPFAAARVPLGFIRDALGDETAARDGYLAAFADLAPPEVLVGTLEVACRVGKVTRILIWERSLAAAREQGAEIPHGWVTGSLESAASVLDEDYLGGA